MQAEVEIDRLGARGDGVAEAAGRLLYVPFALPGERWRVGEGGSSLLLRAHPARADPACVHFGTCGGCVAQHMPDELYAAWKREVVVEAFRHRGITAPVAPLSRVPLGSRRRVTLYAKRDGRKLSLGFHQRGTHLVVDIAACPIAVPAIVRALPALREMLEPILSGPAEATAHVLATPQGLDVHVSLGHAPAPHKDYPRLATLAGRHGFARLTVGRDTVLRARAPLLTFDGVSVEPPPGSFVQAVAEAELEMIRLVTSSASGARRVADLFCGIGTFTFPLAQSARVLAVDSRRDAADALDAAARHAQGRKPIEVRVRDLFRTPLATKELEAFDAVVLDPPAAGAKAQVAQIARSPVPLVVYVSCDPGTLARDVRTLADAGYALQSVTPIDQFLFSAHVEAVAVMAR